MSKYKTERFFDEPWNTWYGTAAFPVPHGSDIHAYGSGNQQLIYSQDHSPLQLNGAYDEGGDFDCYRREFEERKFGPTHNRTRSSPGGDSSGQALNYYGCYHAKYREFTDAQFPNVSGLTAPQLAVYGTRAIANCIPTNPLVDLSVSLSELKREGIPQIAASDVIRDKAYRFRSLGGDYLNSEFGWKPFVSDIVAATDSISKSQQILDAYVANSGKLIRRRFSFDHEYSTTSYAPSTAGTDPWPAPAVHISMWNTTGAVTRTTTTRQRIWFSGAFTYYLPPKGSLAFRNALLAKQYGHRITPEVLWNLAPWSWLSDWVVNVGDVLSNVASFSSDGLTMPYAYVMCETSVSDLWTHSGARTKRFDEPVEVWQRFTSTRKQRQRASPFGFGLVPGGFTDRQWAILVALGLAKGHGQMA